MTELQKKLFELSDGKYADFQAKLAPTVTRDSCMGVRLPILRQFAKEYRKSEDCPRFIGSLLHKYYDENILHSVILSGEKNFDDSIEKVEAFLPYIDNWAVCDTLTPKVYAKNKDKLLPFVKKWILSEKEYTCRFGIGMLMTHYLDGDFKPEYIELPAAVDREEYYVKMMVAWYFATALAKQWDSTVPYIERGVLPLWVHNKTIQKAIESYRITDEQKDYLRSKRRKV